MKQILSYLIVILCGVALAAVYYVFIVENGFAPAGFNGIATMIQYKTGVSISYLSLWINLPLSVLAYVFVQREFAIKTLLFSLAYSASYLLLQHLPLSAVQYNAMGHDTVYPVILSGVLSGLVYGVCFRNNASTGGTDVISRYISMRRPSQDFFALSFWLNALVAVASVFVYSQESLNYKPMALCVLYCFLSSFVGNQMLKSRKSAYKFTIITENKNALARELLSRLHHGCTEIKALGSFSGREKHVLICVIPKHQLYELQRILAGYSDTFSYFERVSEIYGNFKRAKQ